MPARIGQREIVLVVLVALFLFSALFLDGFLTLGNLLTLLQNVAVLGILGLAMGMVVIGRGIDLSLIAAMAIPSGLALQLVQDGTPLGGAIAVAFLLAALLGAVNGWLVAFAEVPAVFATLATGIFLAGFGQAFLFDVDVVQWSEGMAGFETLGQGSLLGIPAPVLLFGVACVCMGVLLRRTRWGAFVYAIGDNPSGARVTGIPTRPVIVTKFVLAALIGCFAGLVMAASVNSMPTRIYNSALIYDAILVVILGGIGLSGGRGGVINVILGTLLIGTMLNAMTIANMSYSAQNLVRGVILLIAVLTDTLLNPRNEQTAQQGDI